MLSKKCIFTTLTFRWSLSSLCRLSSVLCIDMFFRQIRMQKMHGIYLQLVGAFTLKSARLPFYHLFRLLSGLIGYSVFTKMDSLCYIFPSSSQLTWLWHKCTNAMILWSKSFQNSLAGTSPQHEGTICLSPAADGNYCLPLWVWRNCDATCCSTSLVSFCPLPGSSTGKCKCECVHMCLMWDWHSQCRSC